MSKWLKHTSKKSHWGKQIEVNWHSIQYETPLTPKNKLNLLTIY